jgi:transposase InsO family protein
LTTLELARSTWHYQQRRRSYGERYGHLRPPLEEIAANHPEYGWRRTTTELRETYGHRINHKVVMRLHKLWDLPIQRATRPPRASGVRQFISQAGERANLLVGQEITAPFQVLYTDFTELVYATGKAQLLPIVDHKSKLVLGWAVGERAVTSLALNAWKKAKTVLRRFALSPEGVIVHQDQDPVFTSYGWTEQLLLKDRARVSYALRGAKDNPEMEGFNSRFKNENRALLQEAKDIDELREVVAKRIGYYNRVRRHSALGNQAPLNYVKSLLTEYDEGR